MEQSDVDREAICILLFSSDVKVSNRKVPGHLMHNHAL